MVERTREEGRGGATERRDRVRDQDELDRVRDWHHHNHLQPGTRTWRTEDAELVLAAAPDATEARVYLRILDVDTGRFTQAALTHEDLEVLARIFQIRAEDLRALEKRRQAW